MAADAENYRQAIADEVGKTPQEYLPAVLRLVRVFRESVELKPAAESFAQGWREAQAGETLPIDTLWEGDVDAGTDRSAAGPRPGA